MLVVANTSFTIYGEIKIVNIVDAMVCGLSSLNDMVETRIASALIYVTYIRVCAGVIPM